MPRRQSVARMSLTAVAIAVLASGCATSGKPRQRIVSPFPSEVPGLSVPNAHYLSHGEGHGTIIRGNEPDLSAQRDQVAELRTFGVTDVLILKTPEKGTSDVDDETRSWLAHGYRPDRIHHLPFDWNDYDNFESTCRQTLKALDVMARAHASADASLFIHCTVGEDRTGFISGLYRMLVERWGLKRAFHDEMCENGYEAGDKKKNDEAFWVVEKTRQGTTPFFLKMAYMIEHQWITLENDPADTTRMATICSPENDRKLADLIAHDAAYQSQVNVCTTSSKFPASPTGH